jgi:hypothetical protein
VAGPDGQRPELVKGEAAVRVMAGHVLDPVQLGVPVRIGRFLPGPRPLERDATLMQDGALPVDRGTAEDLPLFIREPRYPALTNLATMRRGGRTGADIGLDQSVRAVLKAPTAGPIVFLADARTSR